MKTRILSLLAVAVIAVASMTSCGKYEDGPGFSMRSKKARLTGEWKMTEFKSDGVVIDLGSDASTIEFKKDGTFVDSDEEKGVWEFSDKKEGIKTKYDNETEFDNAVTITRLTNKELWIFSEYTEDNETTKNEFKFEKQ
jgi:hypothetical protein